MNGQNYSVSVTETALQRCSVIQEVFGGCYAAVAGRGPSPTQRVTEVLPDSEYSVSHEGRKMCGKTGWTQDIKLLWPGNYVVTK